MRAAMRPKYNLVTKVVVTAIVAINLAMILLL